MLMSIMSVAAASAIRAPSAIQWASQPASCTTCRRHLTFRAQSASGDPQPRLRCCHFRNHEAGA